MPSSGQIIDLSASSLRLRINNTPIEDFMDDSNPLEFQDTDLTQIDFSCNGAMCRTMKPACIVFSVTVIPGSPSHNFLMGLWKESFSNDGTAIPNVNPLRATLTGYGKGNMSKQISLKLRMGTCIGGTPGCGINSSGKMGGVTFSFAFAQCE